MGAALKRVTLKVIVTMPETMAAPTIIDSIKDAIEEAYPQAETYVRVQQEDVIHGSRTKEER